MDLDKLIEATKFEDEQSRNDFLSKIKDHIAFLTEESKAAFLKRDQIRQAFKNVEAKINELSTKKQDPTKAKMLEQQIIEHASKNKAYKPSEIYKLLKDDFTFDNEKGTFTTKEGVSVEGHIKNFLDDESNSHHVLSGVKSGSGHSYSPLFRENKKSRKIGKEDSEEADSRGLELSDWLKIKELREKKLDQIHKKG